MFYDAPAQAGAFFFLESDTIKGMKKGRILFIIGVTVLGVFFLGQLFITDSPLSKHFFSLEVNERLGEILPMDNTYTDLMSYEKQMIDTFFEKNPDYVQNYKTYGDEYESVLKDSIKLRYYDKENVIFYTSNQKGGYVIDIYDRKSWSRRVIKDFTVYNQDIKSKKYLIVVYENKIFYFKVGMNDFDLLKDSELLSKNESYIGSVGPGGPAYELSFDESTQTLKLSVFKTTNPDNGLYPKLREVQFVLE